MTMARTLERAFSGDPDPGTADRHAHSRHRLLLKFTACTLPLVYICILADSCVQLRAATARRQTDQNSRQGRWPPRLGS